MSQQPMQNVLFDQHAAASPPAPNDPYFAGNNWYSTDMNTNQGVPMYPPMNTAASYGAPTSPAPTFPNTAYNNAAFPTTTYNNVAFPPPAGHGFPAAAPFSSGPMSSSAFSGPSSLSNSFDDEPPLLEELGINLDHIWTKTRAVIHPLKPLPQAIFDDFDLAGPLFFCLLLGFCLLLTGKVHFGYIYGFGIVGCLLMYLILNLMSDHSIDVHLVMSVLGYCLLPVVVLAAINVIINLKGTFGTILTVIAISWCTGTATRLFENALQMREQRYLIAYPIFLLFSVFAMITVL